MDSKQQHHYKGCLCRYWSSIPIRLRFPLVEAVLAENGVDGNCGAAEISCQIRHGHVYRIQFVVKSRLEFRRFMARLMSPWTIAISPKEGSLRVMKLMTTMRN